jgi:hypothetical protein
MSGLRIKGQEVELMLVVDGVVQASLTDFKSFEVMLNFEIKEEGFLGEKNDRYDEVYKGVSGSADMQNSSPDTFTFFDAVKSRAQRRTPGTLINAKATMNYPSGQKRRVIISNIFFDPMGLSFAGRTEYGATKLSFKASEYRAI